MTETKAEWRERLLRTRRAIDADTRRTASAEVVVRLAELPAFTRARSILLYVPVGAEVDVQALALAARHAGKDVYRPASASPPPAWVVLDPPAPAVAESSADATTARARAEQPVPADPSSPVLLVAPAVGFDPLGVRLGRGAGYYDRAIATLRATADVVVVGVAYDAQVVDALPRDAWDQCVDLIVTERRVLVPQPSRLRDPSRRDAEEVRDDH
jgi:5-formyltetrahydrofolate cyclo-ligase